MASIYTYPHVNISTKALQRRKPTVAESNATTLLAPFTCDRGPENELVAIDNFADFIQTFGELDYSVADQRQILNIGNWLSHGGRVLACRLTDINSTDVDARNAAKAYKENYYQIEREATSVATTALNWNDFLNVPYDTDTSITGATSFEIYKFVVKAKYSGTYYNDITVTFSPKATSKGYYDVVVSKTVNGVTVNLEKYNNKTFSTFSDIEETSSYIGEINVYRADFSKAAKKSITFKTSANVNITTNPYNEGNDGKLSDWFKTNLDKFKIALGKTTGVYVTDENGVFVGNAPTGLQIDATSKEVLVCANSSTKVGKNVIFVLETRSLGGTDTLCAVPLNTGSLTVTVSGTAISTPLTNSAYYTSSTKYIVHEAAIDFGDELDTVFTDSELATPSTITEFQSQFSIALSGGQNVKDNYIEGYDTGIVNPEDSTETIWKSYLYSGLKEILKQPLETPFDVMIDSGYHISIKKELEKLFAIGEARSVTKETASGQIQYTVTEKRDDAFLVLNDIWIKGNGRRNTSAGLVQYPDAKIQALFKSGYENITVETQYHKIEDIYSKDSGKQVYVSTSYFVAGLYPYNDLTYGPQWPSAGLTRGVIQGSLWVDSIPTNVEKQAFYDGHINYVEKDSRGTYIMSQLTATTDDTALKFANNERALLKMKRQLTTLARQYLHEFNDSITIDNLQNTLNTCIANWIQNRTLSYASVGLEDYTTNSTLTNEELLITLDIKFTGTIEVISVEITVE